MDNLLRILNNVIDDAIVVGFPVPNCLERKIYIDKKRYDRVGACYRYRLPERYEIHLSEHTLRAKQSEIKNIIAHEVLHASFLTAEHNNIWKMYCDLMSRQFGYDIQVIYSWQKILK